MSNTNNASIYLADISYAINWSSVVQSGYGFSFSLYLVLHHQKAFLQRTASPSFIFLVLRNVGYYTRESHRPGC